MSTLVLRVRDETGRACAARTTVRSAGDDRAWWPASPHVRSDISRAFAAERSFVTDGEAILDLPPGGYEVTINGGPESVAWNTTIEVASETVSALEAPLERWIDMSARGWGSVDVHIHRRSDESPLLLRSEGLTVGPVITDHLDLGPGDGPGRIDRPASAGTGAVEVERICGGPGALIGLGVRAMPAVDVGTWEPFDDAVADAIRAAGGHVDGEKVFWPSIPVLAVLGRLDSVELACNHFGADWTDLDLEAIGAYAPAGGTATPRALVDWIFDLYSVLLGCGLRVPATGGSGSGVMPNPVGASRTYVRLDGPPDDASCLAAIRRGRTFSTNGPMLELEVAGRGPGRSIKPLNRRAVPVRLAASSARPLDTVELIVDGRPTQAWSPSGTTLSVETEVAVTPGGWIAARAIEHRVHPRAIGFAHTSPIRIEGRASVDPGSVARMRSWLDWTADLLHESERRLRRPAPAARRGIGDAYDALAARESRATRGGR